MSNDAHNQKLPTWDKWGSSEGSRHTIKAGELVICLGVHGQPLSILHGDIQISQYHPSVNDNPISGLWLRRRANGTITDTIPLLGHMSRFTFLGSEARWDGKALGISWTVTLHTSENGQTWAWRIKVKSENLDEAKGEWDIASAQDIALAPVAQAMSSEPYLSQYVAYHAENVEGYGRVLAARQTMASAPHMPMVVSAFVEGAAAHLTDGFDFYGLAARAGYEPKALGNSDWNGGKTNQYEFGMICLLSQPQTISENNDELVFTQVNLFDSDWQGEMADGCALITRTESLTDLIDVKAVADAINTDDTAIKEDAPTSLLSTASMVNGLNMSSQELFALTGDNAYDIENDKDGSLLSYFGNNECHVVSQRKELITARSHGQILLANGSTDPRQHIMAATTYMPGVFASHIVYGNTNMNRLVSVHRTSLNLLRSQGVRILVKINGEWRLLGMPSVYIMNLGGSEWVYRLEQGDVHVRTVASADTNVLLLHITSDMFLEFIVTIDIEEPSQWEAACQSTNEVTFTPIDGTLTELRCPNLRYTFASDVAQVGDDAPLFEGQSRGSGVVTFSANKAREVNIAIAASDREPQKSCEIAEDMLRSNSEFELDCMLDKQHSIIAEYAGDLHVDGNERLNELNRVIPWFTQNALVHFLSPHGLEQYSGAAWGTRDVCQGPFELALTFGHFDTAREIILTVLSHQNQDGSLPQWFMFDEYVAIYQHDSHGDIPVWPLMAVGEYLEAVPNTDILNATAPYWDKSKENHTECEYTVRDHLLSIFEYIQNHRVPGTDLFSYGEGDWDDTLQPAKESMKKEMASTWTISLLYQATERLARILPQTDELAKQSVRERDSIYRTFERDFIQDGVLAGYVAFANNKLQPVIHPEDDRTGISYRLIPMTRSIIAGLLTDDEALHHESIINKNLHYPDGVRLMNKPAAYHDGITTVFKRGEQAANVGREIGLMYTHAHIRYVEALAALGRNCVADELLRISPVGQFRRLKTSEARQRNCYFASSDADFPTRYEAAACWDRLRADSPDPVGVRGGWRVYSSGPGIYLRQVMQHVFGLSIHNDGIIIDPLLTQQDDGTRITLTLFNRTRTIHYHVSDDTQGVSVTLDGSTVEGLPIEQHYRDGGVFINQIQLGNTENIDITINPDRARIH